MRRKAKLVLGVIAALGLWALTGGRRGPGARKHRQVGPAVPPPGGKSEGGRKGWDEVDEASYESFPASDPPSFAGGRAS